MNTSALPKPAGGDTGAFRGASRRWGDRLRVRLRRLARGRGDAGSVTAEYAIGTVAACAFAAVLYRVVTSEAVSGLLNELLQRALHVV
ncbi:DUF4244 domain-containing protein [Kitasatospora camelliae]|uniref:DUF4244 domain-containing protein n=1 Tax=Kitasatospora camelliae TaxID=3156397 RepID=A0AAU8JVR9_9ACTN